MKTIKLYSYFRSSSAYRVRIALHLKKVDFIYVPVHLLNNGGEQLSEDFKLKNPASQVPCLEVEGKFFNQTMAILNYLDQTYKEPQLFSDDPLKNAHIIELCEIINSGIQPIQNLAVLKHLKQQFNMNDEQKINWGKFWIERGFDALEKQLRRNTGQYSMGNILSAVDLYLIPQVYNAFRFNVDMQRYTTIQKIYDNCMTLEAFKKADPHCQPDTPDDLRVTD
ncbi:MAG: maleylacetoacetate isomerase [Bdellovibrionaceae bacterium]|jgi:maleylacetoacetate isomerase|nr:maleylacetoacetate isomerase [Pseudobdellovibrionaceae bacterium]